MEKCKKGRKCLQKFPIKSLTCFFSAFSGLVAAGGDTPLLDLGADIADTALEAARLAFLTGGTGIGSNGGGGDLGDFGVGGDVGDDNLDDLRTGDIGGDGDETIGEEGGDLMGDLMGDRLGLGLIVLRGKNSKQNNSNFNIGQFSSLHQNFKHL